MELKRGQCAVVTGAASGIGRALAERFARAGLRVVLADVDAGLDAVAGEVADVYGVATLAQRCDVRHADEVDALAAVAIERFGSVEVVCNNAGIGGGGDAWGDSFDLWRWTFEVNVFGVVHGVRAFLPHLRASGGHIVNTASVAGLYPGLTPIYDASKHAVVALTENLYRQLRRENSPVGVSCLCPGWVRTNIMDSARTYPAEYGDYPAAAEVAATRPLFERVISEGAQPGAVADLVAEAVGERRFWVFTDRRWIDLAARRWETVAMGIDPVVDEVIPGF